MQAANSEQVEIISARCRHPSFRRTVQDSHQFHQDASVAAGLYTITPSIYT